MAEVRFHPEAQAGYDAALAWYQARSPRVADRFEAEVEHVLGLVSANPAMFPPYDDEHRFTRVRRFPYSLVHQSLPDGVYIVAVAHSRRRPSYWGRRRLTSRRGGSWASRDGGPIGRL